MSTETTEKLDPDAPVTACTCGVGEDESTYLHAEYCRAPQVVVRVLDDAARRGKSVGVLTADERTLIDAVLCLAEHRMGRPGLSTGKTLEDYGREQIRELAAKIAGGAS